VTGDHVDLDVERITKCFDRHHVEYLIVGGVAATLYGAARPTGDFDSLAATSTENLTRLAGALKELSAFLHVEGLTDDESRALVVPIDAVLLSKMDISTWRTNAGDIDVLTALPTRDGGRRFYHDLAARASQANIEPELEFCNDNSAAIRSSPLTAKLTAKPTRRYRIRRCRQCR